MSQSLLLKIAGLFTNSNQLSAVPEGALSTADNIVINRDSIGESRRGLNRLRYRLPLTTDRADKFYQYQNTLLFHYNTTSLGYYNSSDGVHTYTGSFSHPDPYLAKIQSAEANQNFYFTSTKGVQKLDVVTGTPVPAGMYKGLDSQATASSNASGFMSSNTQVAYRTVWGITDANSNLVLGAPSQRAVIVNSSGSAQDVQLQTTIPSGVTTSHFLQVYRSDLSATSSTAPNDNMKLVYEASPTSAEITAKSMTFIDAVPDSLKGAALYTNDTQQGILQSNEVPPYATDLAVFRNCLFFANTKTKQRLQFSILSVGGTGGIHTADTLTIAGTTYTAADGTGASSYSFTVTAANATAGATYTNNAQTFTVTTTIAGATTLLCTSTGAPAASGTLTKASGTGDATITFTTSTTEIVSVRQYKLVTGGSAAQNINDTALSLIRVINQNSTNTNVYAYYVSTPTGLPGQILIEERVLGGSAYYMTASAHGTAFFPALPTSGTTVASSNAVNLNGLMFSKQQVPDAVPSTNILYVGSASKKILRIVALRDSLFILKEDGVYRCTGSSPSNFSVDLLDNTAILLAPESAVTLNNKIYALTSQGVVAIDDAGVDVRSRPIEDQLVALLGAPLQAMQYYSFGVGYESERKYILWTVTAENDTYATQAFVYNVFTKAWTRWLRDQQHAIVLTADDKLYAVDPTTSYLNQERKDGTYRDYADETVDADIVSFSNFDVVLADITGITVGDLLYQTDTNASVITAIDTNTKTVTVTDPITWVPNDAAYTQKAIPCVLEWVPNAAQNPGLLKHWTEATMMFKQNAFNTADIGFYSDASGGLENTTINGSGGGLWGRFRWGLAPWGGISRSIPIRTYVPLEKQRCDLLSVRFSLRNAWGRFQLEGVSLVTRGVSPRMSR